MWTFDPSALQTYTCEPRDAAEEAENAMNLPSGEGAWSLFNRRAGSILTASGFAFPVPSTGTRYKRPPEFASRYLPSFDQLGASQTVSAVKIVLVDLSRISKIVILLLKRGCGGR